MVSSGAIIASFPSNVTAQNWQVIQSLDFVWFRLPKWTRGDRERIPRDFLTTVERTVLIDARSVSKKMWAIVPRSLSGAFSCRKGKARNLLSTSLLFLFFHSQNIAHIEEEIQQKNDQAEKTKTKYLFRRNNCDLHFGFRRSADKKELGATSLTSNIWSLNEKIIGDNCQLLKHDKRGLVCYIRLWFSPFPLLYLRPIQLWRKEQSQF